MDVLQILLDELKGSFEFFSRYTNLDTSSQGFGLTVDSTKKPNIASIASTGFALTAWVIAARRGYLDAARAVEITRATLHTLLHHVSHHRGFFAHYLHIESGERYSKCEFSTIDTALCINGVITAAAYFQDAKINSLAEQLLDRVDWDFIVFEKDEKTLFRMAYNPDIGGDYVTRQPGFIHQWDMAAEQKMIYLQAAAQLESVVARRLYHGFRRDIGVYDGKQFIINPGGTLFAYLFSEAWLDTGVYLDPNGVNWYNNTRLAALANRSFCLEHSIDFKTYHENSWGCSAGDSPWGYDVSGSTPALVKPIPNGTVSIYSALSCLPFIPEHVLPMINYLYRQQPQTWGTYGFYDSYNLSVSPPWYSSALYGIDKGCSMIMIENYLSRLVWDTYTQSPIIKRSLDILGFTKKEG